MAIIKIKDSVPQVYVAESRDFQLFATSLDFVENATKFDIDSITNILNAECIPSEYLDNLKSKLGFYTTKLYDDHTLRIVLSAFPHIIRHKGSLEGIERCVNTFLNIMGVRDGCRIEIFNKTNDENHYTIKIGVHTDIPNVTILKDMLSYVIPTGYIVKIYNYDELEGQVERNIFDSKTHPLTENDYYVRSSHIDDELKDDIYNTAQLSTVASRKGEVTTNE